MHLTYQLLLQPQLLLLFIDYFLNLRKLYSTLLSASSEKRMKADLTRRKETKYLTSHFFKAETTGGNKREVKIDD